MLSIAGRNAIVHRIVSFDVNRIRCPQGRHRKLSTAYLLDRIFFVCRTGCQWSQLPVENSSYKTVYHYFSKLSKAKVVRRRILRNGSGKTDDKHNRSSQIRLLSRTCTVRKSWGKNPTDRGRKATKVLSLDGQAGYSALLRLPQGEQERLPHSSAFAQHGRAKKQTVFDTTGNCWPTKAMIVKTAEAFALPSD